jgi:hypothetical protein
MGEQLPILIYFSMSCALTQGYTLDCREGIGGLKEVYIMELANLSSSTELSGVITSITKATGKRFWKYSLVRETSNAEETISGNEQNGTIFYDQTVNIVLNKRQASVRNEVMLLAKNFLVIIGVENSGKAFMYGKTQGLQLLTGKAETGVAWGDRNGYTLPFNGKEQELAPEVNSSLIASLETPG